MDNGVRFTTDQYGWILLSQTLGSKVVVRAVAMDKIRRIRDENDHRAHQVVAEGSVKVKSKYYDTSEFINKFK